MPIDFFIAPCLKVDGNCKKAGVVCKSSTTVERFGLSDRNSDKKEPAFIDIADENCWDLTVENLSNKEITFKAVDFCVDIFRVGDNLIKRCEGFLYYENKIIFVEIKNRPKSRGRWLSDAREKFEETILKFKESYPDNQYELLEPVLSNRLFPRVHQNEMIEKRRLKDAVGLDFQVRTTITIN